MSISIKPATGRIPPTPDGQPEPVEGQPAPEGGATFNRLLDDLFEEPASEEDLMGTLARAGISVRNCSTGHSVGRACCQPLWSNSWVR